MPERGLSYEQLVDLIYPSLPDELRGAIDEAGSGDLTDISTVRKMLGTIEHQVAPTTFTVQLTEMDAERCTVGGVELYCDTADAAVTPGLRSGVYEPHLTQVFERYCRPGMTVVDVGANLGYYSLLASRLVGTSGRVIALGAELGELPASAVVDPPQRQHQRRSSFPSPPMWPRAGRTTPPTWAPTVA